MLLSFLTIPGYLVTVVVGGISIYEFIKRTGRGNRVIFAFVATGALVISLVLTLLSTTQSSRVPTQGPHLTGTTIVQGNTVPPGPTNGPTPTPTLTLTPIPTQPVQDIQKILHVNTALTCDCSDPVVVTITKIEIQPQQNRMIWTLTFYNNTAGYQEPYFGQLTLEEGDQVNYPTTGEPTYNADPSGKGMLNDGSTIGIALQPNQTRPIIFTFSFVPYQDMPYTLVSQLTASPSVTFKSVVILL